MERFVIPHDHEITKDDRRALNGHGSAILWFTGLPSSGKSTLANEVEKVLIQSQKRTYILDGDNVRMGLCGDLGFSAEDREDGKSGAKDYGVWTNGRRRSRRGSKAQGRLA